MKTCQIVANDDFFLFAVCLGMLSLQGQRHRKQNDTLQIAGNNSRQEQMQVSGLPALNHTGFYFHLKARNSPPVGDSVSFSHITAMQHFC